MPIRPLLPIIVLLALSGCVTTGLHNSTKVFTDPSGMRPSDWSDPAEMERAWQAALVRIPKSGGGYVSTTTSSKRVISRPRSTCTARFAVKGFGTKESPQPEDASQWSRRDGLRQGALGPGLWPGGDLALVMFQTVAAVACAS